MVLLKHRCFPLIIRTESRLEYYDALLAVDRGDLAPLVERVRALQGDELVGLSQVAVPPPLPEVASLGSVSEVIEAIRRDEYNRGDRHPKEWQTNRRRLGSLFEVARARLKRVQHELQAALQGKVDGLQAPAWEGELGSATLFFDRSKPIAIEFAIGTVGEKPRGIGQANLAFTEGTTRSTIGRRFLVTYAEPESDVEARFIQWLETGLIAGLQKWRAMLTA